MKIKQSTYEDLIIDNILIDNPNENTFIFDAGNYYITKILLIDRPNVKFIGNGYNQVHIIQQNMYDGFDVESDGFDMRNISLHVEHNDKVAIIFAGCNNTSITNCYIYGNSTTFSVYYAGPHLTAGDETVNAYNSGNLDSNNVFKSNVVYSNFSGDAISFSLQKDGIFTDNIIRGGKVAVYMCRDVIIKRNDIYDSTSEGIYLSLPSYNVAISSNKIYNCQSSGIKIAEQIEHPNFEKNKYDITISNNKFTSSYINSIAINDCNTIFVIDNMFLENGENAVYVARSNNVHMVNNVISYFNVGVIIFGTENLTFTNNELYSIYPKLSTKFVQIIDSDTINVSYNFVKGNILYMDPEIINSNNVNVFDNVNSKYYTRQEENKVLKL